MDRVWTNRSIPYKICLVSLLAGICPFLLGFAAPDWLWFTQDGDNGTKIDARFGLWELCLNYICTSNPLTGNQVVEGRFLVWCQHLKLFIGCSVLNFEDHLDQRNRYAKSHSLRFFPYSQTDSFIYNTFPVTIIQKWFSLQDTWLHRQRQLFRESVVNTLNGESFLPAISMEEVYWLFFFEENYKLYALSQHVNWFVRLRKTTETSFFSKTGHLLTGTEMSTPFLKKKMLIYWISGLE